MGQSSGVFGSEDEISMINGQEFGGMKEYDTKLVDLLSIAHLSKEPSL